MTTYIFHVTLTDAFVCCSEEEGRRCLAMEQEEKGLKGAAASATNGNQGPNDDNAAGAIDITAINSPVSAHSSGYSSADDENLISPNNSTSHFSPFSPDEDFAGISFDGGFDAGNNALDHISSTLPPSSVATSIAKDSGMGGGLPYLSMSPMHNPNFDDIIDVVFDPLDSFPPMPSVSQPGLLAVSSSPSNLGITMSDSTPSNSASTVAMVTSSQQQSQLSPHSNGTARVSVSANSSVTMNCNFDNDVEMMESEPMDTSGSSSTSNSDNASSANDSISTANTDSNDSDTSNQSGGSGVTSNITINLPPGFNPKGQDGKKVLLDVLRTADKSQLLKIHEQINAAMASISQGRSNGKAIAAPELQISITPASSSSSSAKSSPVSATSMSTSPIFSSMMTASSTSNGNILSSNTSSTVKNNGASKQTVVTTSTSNDMLGVPSLESTNSPMDISSVSTNVDNVSSMFTDVDAQLPGFDILDTATPSGTFSESLLNDVNLGAPVSVAIPQTNNTHIPTSKVVTSSNRVITAPRNGINGSSPVVMSSVVKPRPGLSNGSYAQQKQARAQSTMATSTKSSPTPTQQQRKSHQMAFVRNGAVSQSPQPEHTIDMAAAVRGLDDHSYTSKCPSRKNNEHVKFAPPPAEKGSYQRMKNAPVLEHLLTTKKPLNPMKGSDHVANGLQQLALQDMESHHGLNQPNLLKKLLTGEMDKTRGPEKRTNASIYTRRGNNTSTAVSPPPTPTVSKVQKKQQTPAVAVTPAVSASAAAGGVAEKLDSFYKQARTHAVLPAWLLYQATTHRACYFYYGG